MSIVDIFSKRQKVARGELADVYQYSVIPEALRVQIVMICDDALGRVDFSHRQPPELAYNFIVNTLCREYGSFRLPGTKNYEEDAFSDFREFIIYQTNTEMVLDAIELSFKVIDQFTRRYDYLCRRNYDEVADNAIDELNSRFKEHGVGYQYDGGIIIRTDSQFIHSEIVKPAFVFLNSKQYSGPSEEFLRAHEHYRKGDNKASLNECLKSFESIMKAICDKRNWTYDKKNATAKVLINVCLTHGLIPSFWQQNFMSLSALLESSVPTGRNKISGHGQGGTPTMVPDYLAAYMLHMTASAIVFLAEANKNLR